MRKSIYIGVMLTMAVLAGCGKAGTGTVQTQTSPAQVPAAQAAETTVQAEATAVTTGTGTAAGAAEGSKPAETAAATETSASDEKAKETEKPMAGLANPWTETDAEALKSDYGIDFNLPEGAANIKYRLLAAQKLAEADFDYEGISYTARIKNTDKFEDIGGMHYTWTSELPADIGGAEGKCFRYVSEQSGNAGASEMVDLCLFYDAEAKQMYSVSVVDKDLNGFDIEAIALRIHPGATAPKTIQALPVGIDLEKTDDYMVNAHFSLSDFDWKNNTLTFTGYTEALYDMVDMHFLKVGDTIEVYGEGIPVRTLRAENGEIHVNEQDADEYIFAPGDGGTYFIHLYDDHHGMETLGSICLPLAKGFTVTDCTDMPGEVIEVPVEKSAQYLKDMPTERDNFTSLNTRIHVANGEITDIVRYWIP